MSLEVARNRHAVMPDLSPLSGEQRKLDFGAARSVDDPGCVKTCTSQECAELFSLSSSLSSGRKHFWFSNLRNRDGISLPQTTPCVDCSKVSVPAKERGIPRAVSALSSQRRP